MVATDQKHAGGFTLIEVACAFAVLGALATLAFLGETSHLRTVGQTLQETVAGQIAASRLEERSVDGIAMRTGETTFVAHEDLARRLHQMRATETVRQLKPGLFEVRVEVSWLPTQSKRRAVVELTTMMARRP